MNTHFNVSDQELTAATGGAVWAIFKQYIKKSAGKVTKKQVAKSVAEQAGWYGTKYAINGKLV